MKKITAILLCMLIFLSTINVVADESIKMYSPDGSECIINRSELDAWEAAGWYSYPIVRVYLEDGTEAVIYEGALNDWINVGWLYEPPTVRLYSNKLGTATVHKSMVDTYLALGWSRLSQVVNFQVTEDTNPEIKVLKDFAYGDLKEYRGISNGTYFGYDNLYDAMLIDCDNDGELELVVWYKLDTITSQAQLVIFDADGKRVRSICFEELNEHYHDEERDYADIVYNAGMYYLYDYYDTSYGDVNMKVYKLENRKLEKYDMSNIEWIVETFPMLYNINGVKGNHTDKVAEENCFNNQYKRIFSFNWEKGKRANAEILSKCFDLSPITMYCRHDYSTIKAFPHEIAKYLSDYYTIDETMTIYSYRESKTIARVGWPQYAAEGGWYPYPVVDMYAPNGTMAIVPQSEMENWKNQGWYDEKYWELGMSFDELKSIYPNMQYIFNWSGGKFYSGGNGRYYVFASYGMGECAVIFVDVEYIIPGALEMASKGYLTIYDIETLFGMDLKIEYSEWAYGELQSGYTINFYYDGYEYIIPCDIYGKIPLNWQAYISK